MSIFDVFQKLESSTPKPVGPPQWILVGLGNPGAQYVNTRHNTGFRMIDAWAAHCQAVWKKHQFHALCADATWNGTRCLLLKPETFMNLSGQAVHEAMQFYQIPPERTLILFDDICLPVGAMRIRKKGSDGGHNGMKNIIYCSGFDTFPRIRVGIGQKPHPDYPLADWVLSAFSADDQTILQETAKCLEDAIPLILQGKIDLAMSRYNKTQSPTPKPADPS